jgi:uncharacterized damage-inducible protein DinB
MTATRVDPPFAGKEREQIEGFLDSLRDTVRVKCSGLSKQDARRSVVPSPLMTVSGLVSHLRWVEAYWFGSVLNGQQNAAPYSDADPDAEFKVTTELDVLLAEYAAECERSRQIAAGLELDHEVPFRDKGTMNLRWVLLHMIEETGRHAGHLDLIREMLDGTTGE